MNSLRNLALNLANSQVEQRADLRSSEVAPWRRELRRASKRLIMTKIGRVLIVYFNDNSPKFWSALPTTLSDSIATIKVVLLDLPASQVAGPRLLLPFPVPSTSRTSISKLKTLTESKVKSNTILIYDAHHNFSLRNSDRISISVELVNFARNANLSKCFIFNLFF